VLACILVVYEGVAQVIVYSGIPVVSGSIANTYSKRCKQRELQRLFVQAENKQGSHYVSEK